MASCRRIKYTAEFKLKVVEFAKTNNNCVTTGKFYIDETNVRRWKASADFKKQEVDGGKRFILYFRVLVEGSRKVNLKNNSY